MFVRTILLAVALCSVARAQPRRDAFGDPLPEGAKARIGTARLAKSVSSMWGGAVLTPDGKFLIAPVPDGALERVELSTGKVVATLGDTGTRYKGYELLALSADGTRGLTSAESELVVWDARTGKVLNRVEPRAGPYTNNRPGAASLSADGSTFAFATYAPGDDARQLAVVWSVGEGKRKFDVPIEGEQPSQVALSANGKVLAVFRHPPAGEQKPGCNVQFWDASSGKKLATLELKKSWLYALSFAADGAHVAHVDSAGTVRLFDPRTGREARELKARAEIGSRATFAPDGKTIAFAWGNGTVWLWDIETDKPVSETKCPVAVSGSGAHLAFTGDKRLVAWGTTGQRAVAWEVPSGKLLTPTGGRQAAPLSMAFSADGKELFLNGERWTERTVERWDVATGTFLNSRKCDLGRESPPGWRDLVVLSASRITTVDNSNRHIFDARTGKVLHDLGPAHQPESPFLTSDGELMLVPLGVKREARPPADKPLKFAVQEPGAAKAKYEIELPGPELKAAKRAPDGKHLVTATELPPEPSGHQFTVLALWDAATGKKVGETKVRGTHFTFAPTNAGVIATNADDAWQPPRLLDLTTDKLLHTFDTSGMTADTGPTLSANGKLVAFGLNAGTKSEVRVFEVASGKLLRTFRGHTSTITALAFSPDGRLLASGAYDTTALIWELPAAK